jgi:hypothetical protein
MEKQTSVEWFFNELQRMQYFIGNDMLEAYKQTKEMHRQEIENAYRVGKFEANLPIEKQATGNQYYNETFKQD